MITEKDSKGHDSSIDSPASPDEQEPHRDAIGQGAPSHRPLNAADGRDRAPEERFEADADASDAQPAPPGGDVPGDEADHEDEVVLERSVVDPPVEDRPSRPKKRGKKRRKRSSKEADSGVRKPTEQEILQRLLEKNEVILQLNKKNIETEAKLKAMTDRRVELMAEFENYRKRTRKEWELLRDQTRAEVIIEILNVVDDFERAMAATGDQDDRFVQGVRLIHNNLVATLEKFGVRKLNALGQPFDPNYHMAVAQIDSETVESSHVVEIIQEGYLMDGNVIRPANVVIAK